MKENYDGYMFSMRGKEKNIKLIFYCIAMNLKIKKFETIKVINKN